MRIQKQVAEQRAIFNTYTTAACYFTYILPIFLPITFLLAYSECKSSQFPLNIYLLFTITWFIAKITLQPKTELHDIYNTENYIIKTQTI